MSHYSHVYSGAEFIPGGGTSHRGRSPGIGRGSGFARTSSPISRAFSTPPPPGVSPVRVRTPDGVFTQVQSKRSDNMDDDDDDLFNDSFDVNDIPEEMFDVRSDAPSNLTQVFPDCHVDDRVESEKEKPRSSDLSHEPDLLSKVLARATSMEEDERISQLDSDGLNPRPANPPLIPNSRNQEQQQQQHIRMEKMEKKTNGSEPLWEFHVNMGESRTESANGEMEGGNEETNGVRVDASRHASSDWGRFESTTSSSRLSSDQVQQLLRGLTPDPRIARSWSEGSCGSVSGGGSSSSSVRRQVSLEDLDPNMVTPIKLVPVARTSRMSTERSFQISADARDIAMAVRHARHAVVDIVDGMVQETGLERHDFPAVSRSMVSSTRLQDQATGLDQEVEITIPELITTPREQVNVTFETGPVVKFIMVAKNLATGGWSVPSKQRFHDVINKVDSKIRRESRGCGSVLEWCSEWGGGVGLMGLRVINPRELNAYRTVVSEINIGGLWYNTYPKTFLAHKPEVSAFLRPELRCFDIEFLPHSLFENNGLLEGGIRVRFTKHRNDGNHDDDSVAPFLKDGGKVVILEADEVFVSSLQRYPHNHSFRLGSSTVKLKGEIDVVDFGEESLGSSLASMTVNAAKTAASSSSSTSSSSSSSVMSSSGGVCKRSAMKWVRPGLSGSFHLPFPVPSTGRGSRSASYMENKTTSRGRGKFRGKKGSVYKKTWK